MATLAGIEIGDEVVWLDRGQWPAVRQSVRQTIGGGLVLHSRPQYAGRPITLDLGNSTDGWVQLSLVRALWTLRDADASMSLDLGPLGAYAVRFRHGDGDPVEAVAVMDKLADPDDEDLYECILRLQEV